jgi:hypothetical protein
VLAREDSQGIGPKIGEDRSVQAAENDVPKAMKRQNDKNPRHARMNGLVSVAYSDVDVEQLSLLLDSSRHLADEWVR